MPAIEKKESFIILTACNFFGLSTNTSLDPEDHSVLDVFLDTPTTRAICARPKDTNASSKLKLTQELTSNKKILVFFKLKSLTVTNDNFHELVQVASTVGNSKSLLIEALRQVWAPTLNSSGLNKNYIKKLEDDILGPIKSSKLIEEELLWKKRCDKAKRNDDKILFEKVERSLSEIRVEFESAETSRDGLYGLEDVLEIVGITIDDLWKLDSNIYNEERMMNLLDIISNEIIKLLRVLIDEYHRTNGKTNDDPFYLSSNACEKWINFCEKNTKIFWPNLSLHLWKNQPYVPKKFDKFSKKIKETSDIRMQHKQLTRLLTEAERLSLGTDNLLKNFDNLQIIFDNNDDDNDNDDKQKNWERFKKRFEDDIAPAEERVIEKLKKQISNAASSVLLVGEFQRYAKLMKRERIKISMREEREALMSSLDDLIDIYQSGPDAGDLLDIPEILQQVQSAKSAEMKLQVLKNLCEELLSDLPNYKENISKIFVALKEAEGKRQNLVDTWINTIEEEIKNKTLSLSTDTAVVELIGSSMMKVNYNSRLTTLVKEARALSGQGIELPRNIKDLVERAGSLAGRARALQQIANFHNTIGDRMVPSQRPLMLTTAMELARAVRGQSKVVWSDIKAVDDYTSQLKEFVQKFGKQNYELASKHIYLRDLIAGLLKGEVVNLVGSQIVWKETLRNMRKIVDDVDNNYGNTKAWKLHWDRQLLKVLGVAYRAALPNLLRNIQDITIELVIRDGNLQWRPPIEEIRAKLYSSIRRFLSIPINFRGVGDNTVDVKFSSLVERSAYLYGGVYNEAEIALVALEQLRQKWLPLAEPATIDIGKILKGKSSQEWEKAFKEAKQWAQDVGKLRGGEIKIKCLCIDTSTTRNDLESSSRRYWDRLSSDLRAEASSRLGKIVEFLSSVTKELDKRPKNIEQVGEAFLTHKKIQQESTGIGDELEAVTDGLSGAHAAWEGLTDRLERHKAVVARQLEDAKINLRHRGIALKDERERWEARWSTKPQKITIDWISSMRERWITLEEQKQLLLLDCEGVEIKLNDIFDEDTELTNKFEAELEAEESNCKFQEEFLSELNNQEAEEWNVARRRLHRLHDWLDSWDARIKIQKTTATNESINLECHSHKIDTFVEKKIKDIRNDIEWIQVLRGDEIADEHWNDLKPIINIQGNIKDITLGQLLKAASNIKENFDKVKEITKKAIAENGIRQALIELEAWEASASLHLQESKDSKNHKINLVGEYSELLARASELKLLLEGAKGASGYERFSARASRCETALFELEERIKVLGLIQRKWIYLEPVYSSEAAPNDSGRWTRADKEFRYLMGEVSRDPRVPSLRRLPMPALVSLKEILDRCQRSLDEFLEEKRSAYPRLYFLSDEDLLELISGSPNGLDSHLPKLYQGIGSVKCDNGKLKAIISPEFEILNLPNSIDTNEPLPIWLKNLEDEIKKALSQNLDKCLNDNNKNTVVQYPAQILLLAERIMFTERCEIALRNGKLALKKLIEYLEIQRAKFRGLEESGDKLTAQKAKSLLLDTVHHLGISRNLLKTIENGDNITWLWNRQLRFYRVANNGSIIIKCAGAEFPYCFEYQGAAVGLVRTKLTERCFLSLTQAMKLGLGGSPTGPAGTGKTESIKALAAILGRLVLVFNCDEGMDSTSMKRILGGLAQAGAWGCFDEFNRLEEKTLSAVAMLVRPLQEAVRDKLSHVNLGDQIVSLNHHCCVFITMNPAGSDYGGRNKLPDSLGRLFRPIGMAHPDKTDIVKALLECSGFLEASTLARQLVETIDISDKLLSKQPHYDWGLRSLRSVLDAMPNNNSNNKSETERLVEAIKSATLSKLTENDKIKFLGLLKDVFPQIDTTMSINTYDDKKEFKKSLIELCDSKNLKGDLTERCEQLYDHLKNRTGVAIVGPSGSGKSLVIKILAEALGKIGENIKRIIIYPGAIPRVRLLGKVDTQTREWKDGLLSSQISSAGNSSIWIVFNGDVEPGWAEALNSALDDNKLLTLSSGVGIKLGPGVKFIFETHKLAGASPATVSRLGVIHLGLVNPADLLGAKKIHEINEEAKNIIISYLPGFINTALKISGGMISSCGLIQAVLLHISKAITKNSISFGLIVGLCLQLEESEAREELARIIYQTIDSWCPDPQRPLDILYNTDIDRLEPFSEIHDTINTDNGPISMSREIPVILRGPRGAGKSSLISAILEYLKKDSDNLNVVCGSSLFGAQDFIARLKRSCVKVESSVNGRIYKPRIGTKIILILEDVHLASKDLQELVRQVVQEGGFHEDDLEFATLPITLICTADSSTKLHPRLNIINIVEIHLKKSIKNIKLINDAWILQLATSMHDALAGISSVKESSFNWTPKDLTIWAETLKTYPVPENTDEIILYLLDAGERLFYPKLLQQKMSTFGNSDYNEATKDVYIWKGGNTATLVPLSIEEWNLEIINTIAKCTREGEEIKATLSVNLLDKIAGLCWAFGSDNHGIILAGRPGAGRKTATKLAAAYSSLRFIDSAPGRGRAGIKAAVHSAGIDGERTLLLLEEDHAREEGLAVLAGAIISRGEIPGLLTPEELDGLVAPLADFSRQEDFTGTLDQYLYHRLKKFLHVVIIIDSSELKKDWLVTSGLVEQCCFVADSPGNEWWTMESSLTNLAMKIIDTQSISPGLKTLVDVHLRISRSQQSPARFLALLQTWQELKNKWSQDIHEKLESLEAGISRLSEAGDRVAKLENEAKKQRKELEEEKGRANAALEQITATMRGATGQRGEMSTLKINTEHESKELARRKIDIERELGKVEPLVEAAAQSVAGIGNDALAEVRSLRAPPTAVRDVLEGVLRLMGIKDTSWNSMKTFLAKRGVKDEIRTWDARRSTSSSLDAVAKLVKERSESFEEKTAKRASIAAAPLAAWVLANLQYGQILQQVAPLEREQRILADKLSAAEAQIDRLAVGLTSVESRVAKLQEQLAEHSRGAAALQLRTESTESSLATARALLQKLNVEHSDWQSQFEELTARKQRLDIEAAEVASLLVYHAPEIKKNNDDNDVDDDKFRKSAIDLLVSERERLLWRAQDLPGDTGSIIGAACALKGPLVPLFIDSSGVAVTWIKANLGNQLEITKPEDSKFLTTLELAVRFGKALLIEEIVELPSVLIPLLRKKSLRLGDRSLPSQQGFKLFLATRRDLFDSIPSEAEAVLFKIILGAGSRSLAERFVEKALLIDTPELEKQRRQALEIEEKLSGERDAARLDLLIQLGATKGQDLLQESQSSQGGNSLLNSLEETQKKAQEIAKALDENKKTREQITKRSKDHERLAKYAALIFKAIKSLTSLSPLYVFSVEEFTEIYLEAVCERDTTTTNDKKEQEIYLEKKLISLTLNYCCKVAYRKHRLTLALYLALNLEPVPDNERALLLDAGAAIKKDDNLEFQIPEWIPEERRGAVKNLVNCLPQVVNKLKKDWILDPMNIQKDENLNSFQKVLVVQALRPDHLHSSLSKYAAKKLGVKNLAPPAWTIDSEINNNKKLNRPVLLLLSPGADPGPELRALALKMKIPEGFIEISLGQGQVEQAEAALEKSCRNGGWILLSNLQLALNWLSRLDSILRSPLCTRDKKSTTRIWLTTEECNNFYPGLAGLCHKLAYEPPEGVKRNLKRSLRQLYSHGSQYKNSEGIFVLAWLHAVLQERRRFVPQGWIRSYEWSEADLEAAHQLILDKVIKSNSNIDWEEGRGLLDVAIYGGRLQDKFDMQTLEAILREIWSYDIFNGRKKLAGLLSVTDACKNDPFIAIERLPDNDGPFEFFGLSANAVRAWEHSTSENVILTLKNMSNNSIIKQFFIDELRLTSELMSMIKNDLEKNMIIDNLITPSKWLDKWPEGPGDVMNFVNALISRHCAICGNIEPSKKIDLSWLLRPRGFLAAFKHYTARECGYSIEGLTLRAKWMDNSTKNDWKCYVILDGLLISGGKIDYNGCLEEVDENAPSIIRTPRCQLAYVVNDNDDLNIENDNTIYVPVYGDSSRKQFICALPVGCLDEQRDYWLKKNVIIHFGTN
ncbi:hypothetical protein HCN44_000861 [Aphidius gifuensis]|uniref:Dynein heavy chain, cytoplasmic n=1 Tax=Aphidius gifuensis TaxID=684658 RepID=A0A834XQK7_APHGI|nr:hypothetical protein HCN44_000861 [Aphidius gifuensis]